MRISVNPEPGFKFADRKAYRVLMDGRQLERVVKVDTCAGVAWVMDTDSEGKIRFDRRKQEFFIRRVYGPMRLEAL